MASIVRTRVTGSAFCELGLLPAGCALTPRLDAHLRLYRNFMLVPAAMNAHPAAMLLDTGAESSTVTPDIAAQLALQPSDARPRVLRGIAGDVTSRAVRLQQLDLGGQMLARDVPLDVTTIPPFPGVSPPVAGLLGADLLTRYEVELDAPNERLTLYTARNCAGYAPWPWPEAVVVPFRKRGAGLPIITARINGRAVTALVDTGARTTLIRRETAISLGVTAEEIDGGRTSNGAGIGNTGVQFHQHRFAEFGVPGDVQRDFVANVGTLNLPGVEMLLGADFLATRHVWISYATGRIFLRRS